MLRVSEESLKKRTKRIHGITLGFRAIDDDGGLRNGVGRGLFELIEVDRVFHDVTVNKRDPVAGGAVFFGKPLDIGQLLRIADAVLRHAKDDFDLAV